MMGYDMLGLPPGVDEADLPAQAYQDRPPTVSGIEEAPEDEMEMLMRMMQAGMPPMPPGGGMPGGGMMPGGGY